MSWIPRYLDNWVYNAPSRIEDVCVFQWFDFHMCSAVVNMTNTGFTAGLMRPQYNKHCRSLTQIPAEGMRRFHECNNVENVQYIDMAGPLRSAVPGTMNNLIWHTLMAAHHMLPLHSFHPSLIPSNLKDMQSYRTDWDLTPTWRMKCLWAVLIWRYLARWQHTEEDCFSKSESSTFRV